MTAPPSTHAPAPTRRRRRRRKFIAAAILLPLLAAFVVGELIVRWRYPVIEPRAFYVPGIYRSAEPPVGWDLLPNYDGAYHRQTTQLTTRTNELAMRDPPLTPERKQASRRVLVLGDSVAFGQGVHDDETFSRQLEQRLQDTAVFNGGVPGYDTQQELARLERVGPSLEPNVVILEWYRNDMLVPPTLSAAEVREGYLLPPGTTVEDFEHWKSRYIDHTGTPLDWSALVRLVRIQVKNYRAVAKLDERAAEPWTVDESDEALQRCLEAIRGMKAWCDAHGAKLVVVLFRAREEVEAEGPEPNYPGILQRLCESESIRYVDLYERWREHWAQTEETLFLPRDRCHPNALGHALAAEWIELELQDLFAE